MAEQQAKQPDIIIPAMTAELLDVLEKRFPQIQLKLDIHILKYHLIIYD